MDIEEARRTLAPLRPKAETLRPIAAFVPFTMAEGETLRRGFLEYETHWVFVPDGDSLELWRDYYGDLTFFWRMDFEDRAGARVMTRVHALADRDKGLYFESDRNQVGAAWYLLEMIVLKKDVGNEEDFFLGADRLASRSGEESPPLALKDAVWAEMLSRAEKRRGPLR